MNVAAVNVGGDILSLVEVDFGLRLLSRLVASSPGKNVIVSPLGLFQALSLYAFHGTDAGRDAMRTALGLSRYNDESLHAMYRRLGARLNVESPDLQLSNATALWLGNAVLPDAAFAALAEQWGVSLFSGSDRAGERMQQWAQDKTRGLLSASIGPPPSIGANLMNAVYFHGKWKSQFKKQNTSDRLFYRAGGLPTRTPLMRQPETRAVFLYRHGKYDGAQIPFVSNTDHNVTLHILLPRRSIVDVVTGRDYITPFVGKFSAGDRDRCQENDTAAFVDLILPQFTFRQTHPFNSVLREMGMVRAFDLSTATTAPFVPALSNVEQQVYVSVDEEGTIAASLLAMIEIGSPLNWKPEPRPRVEKFYVNRPFVFLLTEEVSGLLLFAGVIHDPTEM
jgi:serine protease inhibitor